MSDKDHKAADGRALWDQARAANSAGDGTSLDENDLAAYLEGTLDEAERDRVEALLASKPEALELAIAAREALDAAPVAEAAQQAFTLRAQALVAAPRPLAALRDFFRQAMQRPAQGLAFASIAAGFLMVSAAGFELGRAEVDYSTQVGGLLTQDLAGLVGRDSDDLL